MQAAPICVGVSAGLSAEVVFERFFRPLYRTAIHPTELDPTGLQGQADLEVIRTQDVNPAQNRHLLSKLSEIAEAFAELAPAALNDADLVLDFSDASVHRLSAHLTRKNRDRLLRASSASSDGLPSAQAERSNQANDDMSPLAQLVIHGCLYVGACIVKNHDATWAVRNPLWESQIVLPSRAGTGRLALFQWWLKSLSDQQIDDGRLADRYRRYVEMPMQKSETLPVIASARRFPRLSKVRYDTLHKYLRAHLPELRDLGKHFPSAARFAELDFRWLDFKLIGDGRMLLMYGPAKRGVHVFWMDADGFRSAAFFLADKDSEPRVLIADQTLVMMFSAGGCEQSHRMLWWGS